MDIEEAIKMAIEFETKVTKVYREAEQQVGDPTGKHIFGVLAEEEQWHIDFLTGKLKEWNSTGNVKPEKLKTSIPTRERIDERVVKLKSDIGSPKSERIYDAEIQMLEKAYKVESDTNDFYKKVIKELPEEGRILFTPFLDIEDGHLAFVQAELDYAKGTGFYFDFREFDLEAGG